MAGPVIMIGCRITLAGTTTTLAGTGPGLLQENGNVWTHVQTLWTFFLKAKEHDALAAHRASSTTRLRPGHSAVPVLITLSQYLPKTCTFPTTCCISCLTRQCLNRARSCMFGQFGCHGKARLERYAVHRKQGLLALTAATGRGCQTNCWRRTLTSQCPALLRCCHD